MTTTASHGPRHPFLPALPRPIEAGLHWLQRAIERRAELARSVAWLRDPGSPESYRCELMAAGFGPLGKSLDDPYLDPPFLQACRPGEGPFVAYLTRAQVLEGTEIMLALAEADEARLRREVLSVLEREEIENAPDL